MRTNQQIDLFRPGQPDDEAIRLLKHYEKFALEKDPRGYCVCTSEGKDSRVLGHLMRRAGVRHFYHHNVTGIDPLELVYFQRRNFQEYRDAGYVCHDVMYKMSMWQLMLKKLIPPLRHMRYCCTFLKESKTEEQGDAMISTGVRKAESSRRAKQRSELERHGKTVKDSVHIDPWKDIYDRDYLGPFDEDGETQVTANCYHNPSWQDTGDWRSGLWIINPIAEWPDHWIWDYSLEAGLEQCSLYQEGFARLGCCGCPMAGEAGRRREFERWPKFKDQYIRIFDKMVLLRQERGMKMSFNSKNAGTAWFEWWLSDRAMEQPIDDDQLSMDDLAVF